MRFYDYAVRTIAPHRTAFLIVRHSELLRVERHTASLQGGSVTFGKQKIPLQAPGCLINSELRTGPRAETGTHGLREPIRHHLPPRFLNHFQLRLMRHQQQCPLRIHIKSQIADVDEDAGSSSDDLSYWTEVSRGDIYQPQATRHYTRNSPSDTHTTIASHNIHIALSPTQLFCLCESDYQHLHIDSIIVLSTTFHTVDQRCDCLRDGSTHLYDCRVIRTWSPPSKKTLTKPLG